MGKNIDCFILHTADSAMEQTITALKESSRVNRIYLLAPDGSDLTAVPEGCGLLPADSWTSTATMRKIADTTSTEYLLLYTGTSPMELGYKALERMTDYLDALDKSMAYADHYEWEKGEKKRHPAIDYQPGSVRDDFDFGPVLLFKSNPFKAAAYKLVKENRVYPYAGMYAIRLMLAQACTPVHVNEYLYTIVEKDLRLSGEKQFDYVNPRNREVQIDMERAFTEYLKDNDIWLKPTFREVSPKAFAYKNEASVIIPVKNRARTIDDAIRSVLEQETDFPYNIIVVDNHSTDGTTEIVNRYNSHPKVIHLVPERDDLGIGGCWDLAIHHTDCGRFAVQLDSDDLYSGPHTLQTIVNAFYEQNCAMVIGSYRMTDFHLNTLPPGVIDHKEWTEDNGRNNALRINGLGAPRAFFTEVLRTISIPNVSYGEDYAMGLAISRHYRIGRIYDVLYLCRRWEGNSDAALSIEQTNANNHYKDSIRTHEMHVRRKMNDRKGTCDEDEQEKVKAFIEKQLHEWPLAKAGNDALKAIHTRTETVDGLSLTVQFNPARMVSTGAATDSESIKHRPCFLCRENRPEEQEAYAAGNYELCVNPYPILPQHLTVIGMSHEPQHVPATLGNDLKQLHSFLTADYALFYNGPACGASAPDHLHLQAVHKDDVPLAKAYPTLRADKEVIDFGWRTDDSGWTGDKHFGTVCLSYIHGYICPLFSIEDEGYSHTDKYLGRILHTLAALLPGNEDADEPKVNILSWMDGNGQTTTLVIPRCKHRPQCYYEKDEEKRLMVSPGLLDMAGIIVTAREEDFNRITASDIRHILQETGISREDARRFINEYHTNYDKDEEQ